MNERSYHVDKKQDDGAPDRPRHRALPQSERIAVNLRASGNRKHTTVPEHMPSSHRRYAAWTIESIREDARRIGPATAVLCEQILGGRQGYRACLGIVGLVGSYGAARVEAAAERAIEDRRQDLWLRQIHP